MSPTPYRTESPSETPGPAAPSPALYKPPSGPRVALALGLLALGALAVRALRHPAVVRLEAPPELLDRGSRFPLAATALEVATPLAPLLATDEPEHLALLEPQGLALHLGRGEAVSFRFNRWMVEGAAVGHELARSPLSFSPALPGTARWLTRSTLQFLPAPEAWSTERTVRLRLSAALRSLAGEVLGETPERTVALDPRAHWLRGASPGQIAVGAPLPLYFDGPVTPGSVAPRLLVFERQGAERVFATSLTAPGFDAQHRYRLDLQLPAGLEPGTRVEVLGTPSLAGFSSYGTPSVAVQVQPGPRVEGLACTDAANSSSCAVHDTRPSAIVDFQTAFTVLASTELAAVDPASVQVRPAVPGLAVTTQGRALSLRGEWAPEQVYELRLPQLIDATGAPLALVPPLAVRSRGLSPSVRMLNRVQSFEASGSSAVGLSGVNLARASLRLAPVPVGRELEALRSWQSASAESAGSTSVLLTSLLPDARANRWGRGTLDWRASTGAGAGGSLALLTARAIDVPGEGESAGEVRSFVQQTDLGLTVRALREGVLVWVTSLAHASPVAGARVSLLYGERRLEGTTGPDGSAWFALVRSDDNPMVYVRAVQGDDRAVLALDTRTAVGPSQLALAGEGDDAAAANVVATLWTDRGIYRPGETLRAQSLVRSLRADRLVVPAEGPLELRLFAPEQTLPVASHAVRLSASGTVDASFAVPEFASQGNWRVELWRTATPTMLGSTSVRVARYRQPTLRADLAPLPASLIVADTLHAALDARYLFGSPLAGAQVHWTVTRDPDSSHAARWADFTFTPSTGSPAADTMDSHDDVLDAAGHGALESTVSLTSLQRTRITVEVEATAPGGESVTARRSLVAMPAAYEVGLRRPTPWLAAGSSVPLQGVALDAAGAPVAGRTLEFTVRRASWQGYWEWYEHGAQPGAWASRRSLTSELVHSCNATSGTEPVGCAFTAATGGEYQLEVRSTDEQGRTVWASTTLYVAGANELADRDPPGSAIRLTPARSRLEVGEQARVAFECPFPEAEALLTVEREGVLFREQRRVQRGGVTWDIPIAAEMVPNAFVHVTLVRPRTGAARPGFDTEAPDLRLGATELTVRPRRAPLTVQLTVPQGPQPAGTQVQLEALVRDAEGHPVTGELTLYGVDEGTLRLTSYRTPAPLDGLFRRRGASTFVEDLRRTLVARMSDAGAMLAGGDGDEAGGSPAEPEQDGEHDDPTAFWLPGLRTDREGRVRTTVRLPERATQYRVMAIAVDPQGRVGSTELPLQAARALVLRPSLPRTLTEGDTFEALWFVHNDTDLARTVTLRAQLNGESRALAPVTVPAHGSAPVRTEVVTQGMRTLRLVLEASADGANDRHEATLTVQPRGRWTDSQLTGMVPPAGRELTVALTGAVPGTASLRLLVARHPLVGLDVALGDESEASELVPAGERAARVLSRTALATLRQLEGMTAPQLAEQRARAEREFEQLAATQSPSGQLGYWPDDGNTDHDATMMMLRASANALALGWRVPPALLERGLAYARSVTDEGNGTSALAALCAHNACDTARVDTLYAARERLTPRAMAELAAALPESDRRRDTLILKALDRGMYPAAAPGEGAPVPELGTLAALLRASVRIPVASARAGSVAAALLRQRQGGRGTAWASPYDTAVALDALALYSRRFAEQSVGNAEARFEGAALTPTSRARTALAFALPQGAGDGRAHTLTVRCSQAPCYFALSGRWAEALTDDDAVARGHLLALHRVLETEQGRALAPGETVQLGERLRVRLFVHTETALASPALLRSPVGGGFEVLDAAFETGPRAALAALLGQGPDDDETIDPRSFRARASIEQLASVRHGAATVSFGLAQLNEGLSEFTYGVRASAVGTFTLPPASLGWLEDPHVRALSATQTLRVVRNP